MALLRRRLATPIAANQSTWTVQNVYNVVAHGAADVVVIGLHWLGGILAFRKAAAIAEAANIPVCRHSSGELGVATAAGLQVLAVVPNQVDGHQTYYSHLADDIIVGDEVHLHGGRQTVPTAPGLGVTVDPDKLKQYSRAYSDNGPYRAYSLDGTQLVSGFGKR
jgi:L-alanine-DL-glutamate epimerase-like enolase superfamily enzyme